MVDFYLMSEYYSPRLQSIIYYQRIKIKDIIYLLFLFLISHSKQIFISL